MRRAVFSALAVALNIQAVTEGQAANQGSFDILGLRLGMAEPQVDAILSRQGVSASRMVRTVSPCRDRQGCNVTIAARTMDGALTIRLIANEADPQPVPEVTQVAYILNDVAVGAVAMIRSSVLDRFGPPSQPKPMTWCASLTASGLCRPDRPSLRFSPEALTLVMTAGTRMAGPAGDPMK
jgi:hypothetical protein